MNMIRVLFDLLFKTIIVGDPNVGKTSITIRFATGTFKERYLPTIGVEFSVKDIEIDKRTVKLQLWDTGSHDRFSYVRPLYYRGSFGVLVVYDITNQESFNNVEKWFEEVYSNCDGEIIPAIMIGNKVDMVDERVISKEEAIEKAKILAQKYSLDSIPYYEVSAKNGQLINEIYYDLTRLMIKKSEELEATRS